MRSSTTRPLLLNPMVSTLFPYSPPLAPFSSSSLLHRYHQMLLSSTLPDGLPLPDQAMPSPVLCWSRSFVRLHETSSLSEAPPPPPSNHRRGYVGEIVRRVIHSMAQETHVFGAPISSLFTPFILRTPLMAAMLGDGSPNLNAVSTILKEMLQAGEQLSSGCRQQGGITKSNRRSLVVSSLMGLLLSNSMKSNNSRMRLYNNSSNMAALIGRRRGQMIVPRLFVRKGVKEVEENFIRNMDLSFKSSTQRRFKRMEEKARPNYRESGCCWCMGLNLSKGIVCNNLEARVIELAISKGEDYTAMTKANSQSQHKEARQQI